mmetsp:Transcript_5985/g.10811  ORF Transcript_5985/g.10811 Transcript_5985/m.10811 type:complete len:130 (+) Transcript_5985:1455-1844(+)
MQCTQGLKCIGCQVLPRQTCKHRNRQGMPYTPSPLHDGASAKKPYRQVPTIPGLAQETSKRCSLLLHNPNNVVAPPAITRKPSNLPPVNQAYLAYQLSSSGGNVSTAVHVAATGHPLEANLMGARQQLF